MLFCSRQFLIFYAAVLGLYWALRWRAARVWLLLAASFYFYACWNRWLALLIAASSTVDYGLALLMQASTGPLRRRALLAISITANLTLLTYFKYANFFLESLASLLRAAGIPGSLPTLSVLLPVGISFYTFEAINYVVDVYRGRVQAERNLAHFLLFITFFPHLVAGPIVRACDFLPQIRRPKRFSWLRAHVGTQYVLMGLCKKMVVADHLAQFVDPVFAAPEHYGSLATWCAVIAYSLQIYCDFSGYSDMAVGTAHLLGYKLTKNFNLPYLAANISEFWRRWHISLSTWLRDYVFVPLGGSRGSESRTSRNLLITMLLGGLWHGASWTFVVWGLLHGMLLVGQRTFRGWCRRSPRWDWALSQPAGTAARVAVTFACVSCCWVLFRATSFSVAATVLGKLVSYQPGLAAPLPVDSLLALTAAVAGCHALAARRQCLQWLNRLPAPVLGIGQAVALSVAFLLAPGTDQTFIYFQF